MRAQGKTAKALANLPDGSIYIVHTPAMVAYCRRLLVHLERKPDAIRFHTLDHIDRLHGIPRSTTFMIDHAVYEWGIMSAKERDLARIYGRHFMLPPVAALP